MRSTLDIGGPYFFGIEGWKLVPAHFAERHGLIVIIALGESIVAIGAGSEGGLTLGIIAAAVLRDRDRGRMWWAYFDVVALVATRRLAEADGGREQNAIARDSYSLPAPADGRRHRARRARLKKTLGHVDEPLEIVPAFALLGGVALYLSATSRSAGATSIR